MAVFRKIHVSFWRDPFVRKLTPEQKYFYLYLMTNEATTQAGIYEIDLSTISHETGYNIETVKKLLDFFVSKDKIKYSVDTDEIALKNWPKFNYSNSPKVKKCISDEIKKVKNRVLIEYLYSMDTHPQEEQEEEQEEEKDDDSPRLLWINIFLHNAGPVEIDFVKKLVEKFGYQRAKTILYDLKKNNFHSVKTMENALDESGNIKPKEGNNLKAEGNMTSAAHEYLV